MVLESWLNPWRSNWPFAKLFLLGFLYASLGMFLAAKVFGSWASLVMVFFTVLAAIPLFYWSIVREEKFFLVTEKEYSLLQRHKSLLLFFLALFLGMLCAFAFWFFVLPESVRAGLFLVQEQTIGDINKQIVTGKAIAPEKAFVLILLNNLRVLVTTIVFSLVYGSGALFILSWNASVLGAAMGSFAKMNAGVFGSAGSATLTGVVYAGVLTLLRYWVHGIPEMAGYFVGGIAGGILSVAIVRHHLATKNFEKIAIDIGVLLLWAVGILLVAAGLEAFVTPLLVQVFPALFSM